MTAWLCRSQLGALHTAAMYVIRERNEAVSKACYAAFDGRQDCHAGRRCLG
jgi:hypothetical protein